MQEHELTVSIGDVVQIGGHLLTVCDIEDGEILFQLQSEDEGDENLSLAVGEEFRFAIPR